ncbi:hypothetical protein AB0F13_21040 [Streptomyces sp. NPDC026206]|uniref:hypothetical protein n=1 Tax=Streptomyces sp. NPDC026206 TaxID=3157089 RepID=UPI003405DEEB
MQREDIPEPDESGLSTEDLAQASSQGVDEEAEGRSEDVPTFPGESTEPAADATTSPPEETAGATGDETPQLLTAEDEDDYRSRWQDVQNRFVDDPREAVHTADALVAEVMQTLATTFAEHKQDLEGQWNRGEEVNTEDLRQALQHYRSFFNRLLTT